MWVATCLILGVVWLFYRLVTDVYGYWERKGIPHLRGRFPYGSMKELLTFETYLGYIHQKAYRLLDPHPYGGIYQGRIPILLVRDPEVIGRILVKDFSHFRDRERSSEGSSDNISKNLFRISGDPWRSLRVKMTPTFSSGKLKNMYTHFETCAQQLDNILREKAAQRSVVDVKDLMTNFTLDIISACAFGLDVQSLNNPDNELRKIGKAVFPPGILPSKKLTVIYGSVFPEIRRFIKTTMYPPEVSRIMTKILTECVDYRTKNNFSRNDFLDLLIELKNSSVKANISVDSEGSVPPLEMSMDLIIAQCFIFLAAGLETSSSVMSFCFYELALNPDIQERLRTEIDDVSAKHGGLTYDAILEMPYLNQVVSETIRKYPTAQYLNRSCSKPYRMPDSGVTIDQGTLITIPVYSLHHDPNYFPDPEKFDPERFSTERKSSIIPYSYLPFGEGPRNCIGLRFGLLQTKLGICTLLSKYKLVRTGETQVPLEMAATHLVSTAKGPISMRIVDRQEK